MTCRSRSQSPARALVPVRSNVNHTPDPAQIQSVNRAPVHVQSQTDVIRVHGKFITDVILLHFEPYMSFTFFLCFFDFVRIHKIVLGCPKYLITDINIYFPFNFLAIAPLRQITSHVRALVLDQHHRKMETPHRIATTKAWTIRLVRCPINYKNIDFSFRLITLETLIQTPYLPKPLKTN